MRLVPCLHQSLLGIYALLVLFPIFLNPSLLLASNIINYSLRIRLCCCLHHRQANVSLFKLMHYFYSYPAAFGFWASSPSNNITLNPANNKTDHSLSDFQTGIGAVAHTISNMEQLTMSTLSSLFLIQHCSCWYNCLSAVLLWMGYFSFRSAWITYQD